MASIALNKFMRTDKTFDFDKLKEVTKIVTKNLNKIIDVNYYPVEEVVVFLFITNIGLIPFRQPAKINTFYYQNNCMSYLISTSEIMLED